MADSQYFPLFQGEMRGYIAALREQVQVLASPTRFGTTREDALTVLRQTGHTLAGLGTTVELPDVALLGEALNEAAQHLLADTDSAARRISVPLTYLTVHLETRLARMSTTARFLPPDAGEMAEAERIAAIFREIAHPAAPPAEGEQEPAIPAEAEPTEVTATIADEAHPAAPTAAIAPAPDQLARNEGAATQEVPVTAADGAAPQPEPAGATTAPLEELSPTAEAAISGVISRSGVSLPGISDEHYSEEIQGIIDEFLQSRMARSDVAFLQSTPPVVSEDHVALFLDEVSDDLARLRALLAEIADETPSVQTLTQMSMLAHKIKGAAYFVDLSTFGAISDMVETMLIALRQGQAALTPDVLRWLIRACDILETLRAQLLVTRSDDGNTGPLAELHEGYAQIILAAEAAASDAAAAPPPVADVPLTPTNPAMSVVSPRGTIRIEARRLDQLMSLLGTMQINLIELGRLRENAAVSEQEIARVLVRLANLHDRLRAERIEAITKGMRGPAEPQPQNVAHRRTPVPPLLAQWMEQHRQQPASDQPELDVFSEFDVLMAMIGEAISDLRAMHLRLQTALNQTQRQQEYHDFLTETVQRDILNLRLAPITDIVARLKLLVSSVAHEEGKAVEFIVESADIMLDADISSAIFDPLSQVVRNAVVHGIETPAERREMGKTATGHVRFRAANDGDGVIITISDDGRGINPQQLIASAMMVQTPTGPLLTPERARELTEEDAFDLMFQPDVSTAVEIRHTAGRGMGLPTVRSVVEGLHGTVSFTSTPGAGTTFTFRLPPSLSTARAIIVRAGPGCYAVPLRDIRRFTILTPGDIFTTMQGQARARVSDLIGGTAELPVITLADLLGHDEIPAHGINALVVMRDRQEYAVIVDEIGEERDLIIRPVPRHLRRRSVRGAAITPQGEVVLILDLPDLIAAAQASGRLGRRAPVFAPAPQRPAEPGNYVLVVDDSPSIRHGLAGMLHELGYAVETARDGIEAITRITQAAPLVMILDVEMPEMNGYELLEVLHAHEPFHEVRAIMLTSRATAKYREHALRLGAVDYLVKPVSAGALQAAITRALANAAT